MEANDLVGAACSLVMERFRQTSGVNLAAEMLAARRVEEACRRALLELCGSQSARIELPFVAANVEGPVHLKQEITRSDFPNVDFSSQAVRAALDAQAAGFMGVADYGCGDLPIQEEHPIEDAASKGCLGPLVLALGVGGFLLLCLA